MVLIAVYNGFQYVGFQTCLATANRRLEYCVPPERPQDYFMALNRYGGFMCPLGHRLKREALPSLDPFLRSKIF